MAVLESLPGELNLSLIRGDEFVFSTTFNVDILGYTLEASLYSEATGTEIASPAMVLTQETVDDATSSTVAFRLTEAQTAMLTPGRMRWYFRWTTPAPGSATRTILAGVVKAVRP